MPLSTHRASEIAALEKLPFLCTRNPLTTFGAPILRGCRSSSNCMTKASVHLLLLLWSASIISPARVGDLSGRLTDMSVLCRLDCSSHLNALNFDISRSAPSENLDRSFSDSALQTVRAHYHYHEQNASLSSRTRCEHSQHLHDPELKIRNIHQRCRGYYSEQMVDKQLMWHHGWGDFVFVISAFHSVNTHSLLCSLWLKTQTWIKHNWKSF